MLTRYGVGNATTGEKDVLVIPRLYKRDGTKMGIVFCHFLGGTATIPMLDVANNPNFRRIITAIVDVVGLPVVSTDLGGAGGWNSNATMTKVSEARTWLQSASGGGAKAGKIGLLCWSMGGSAAVRWAADNPSLVACMVGLQPASDLNDFRNFNRAAGWSGTVQNVPQIGRGINVALGLADFSTADYPTHGQSLATLPSGTDPLLHHPTTIPAKAWATSDDAVVIASTVYTLWEGLMGGQVIDAGTGGHSDTGLNTVDAMEVAQFFADHQT